MRVPYSNGSVRPSVRLCVRESIQLERNGYVHYTVPRCATLTKLTQTVLLDMIYRCHKVVCVLDLHFTLESPWLERNGYVHYTVPRCATFTKLTSTVYLDMIYSCHMVVCVLDLHFTLE